MKKVYVLNCAWNFTAQSGDVGMQTRVFDTLSYAQEQMLADVEHWCEVNDIDEWTIEQSDTNVQIYVMYEFDLNHIVWDIGEVEIEFDPENK